MIADNAVPNFLLKLWRLVDDCQHRQCIYWDQSGFSFFVRQPYNFSKTVLPLYFKHSNLNSFIRQLNMYGFRKVTNLDKGASRHAAVDQEETLEFQHPFFVRDHAELLQYIKRKVTSQKPGATADPACVDSAEVAVVDGLMGRDLNQILTNVRQLREKQSSMDTRLNQVKKENHTLWREVGRMRQMHVKQQQVVNKLIQLLLALVQNNGGERIGKRQLLAIGPTTMSDQEIGEMAKRFCSNVVNCDDTMSGFIETLHKESQKDYSKRVEGPIISDVTAQFNEQHLDSTPINNIQTGDGGTRQFNSTQAQINSDNILSANGYQWSQQASSAMPSAFQNVKFSRQMSAPNPRLAYNALGVNNFRPEFSEYLNYVQSDLESLKTILMSDSYCVDQSSLGNLFSMNSEANNTPNTNQTTPQQIPKPTISMSDQLYKPQGEMYKDQAVEEKIGYSQTFDIKSPQTDTKPALTQQFQRPPSMQFYQRQTSMPAYYGQYCAEQQFEPSFDYVNQQCQQQSYNNNRQQESTPPMLQASSSNTAYSRNTHQQMDDQRDDDESESVLGELFSAAINNVNGLAPIYENETPPSTTSYQLQRSTQRGQSTVISGAPVNIADVRATFLSGRCRSSGE